MVGGSEIMAQEDTGKQIPTLLSTKTRNEVSWGGVLLNHAGRLRSEKQNGRFGNPRVQRFLRQNAQDSK